MQPEPALHSVRVGQPTQYDNIVASQSGNYLSNLLGSVLLDQTGNSRRQLGALTLPIGKTIGCNTQAFCITGGYRVVKADTLNETTITTIT